MNSHKNSSRFSEYNIQEVVILFEGTYEECDKLEEEFIASYGTFSKGLNMTNRGKGKNLSDRFNTLGYKFSDASRKKMSESSKSRTNRPTGYTHTDETKERWSGLRKGKVWGPVKIDAAVLIQDWHCFSPNIKDMEHMLSKAPRCDGKVFFKNGREFSYNRGKLVIFKKIKSIEYGVTPEAVKRIITNEQLL